MYILNMKNSKFIIDKLGKLFEQGIISSKDLSSELFNILKSKRDEIVFKMKLVSKDEFDVLSCLLYTSPSPRDRTRSRMPSSA